MIRDETRINRKGKKKKKRRGVNRKKKKGSKSE